MQDIKINMTYSITTNTFSNPDTNQSISQQISNTIRKVQEDAEQSKKVMMRK